MPYVWRDEDKGKGLNCRVLFRERLGVIQGEGLGKPELNEEFPYLSFYCGHGVLSFAHWTSQSPCSEDTHCLSQQHLGSMRGW